MKSWVTRGNGNEMMKMCFKSCPESKYSCKDMVMAGLIFLVLLMTFGTVFIVFWALVTKSNERFMAEFSFASTISSIILSVIAIIMSILSEKSTGIIRGHIEQNLVEISGAIGEMRGLVNSMGKNVKRIKKDMNKIKDYMFEQSPQETNVTENLQDEPSGIVEANENEEQLIIK